MEGKRCRHLTIPSTPWCATMGDEDDGRGSCLVTLSVSLQAHTMAVAISELCGCT